MTADLIPIVQYYKTSCCIKDRNS